ncbi:MAG: class II aldolase/adducin family protein [Actinobacteria bacterium]|nr:class II aldolase/adducin family protein [Actinomycetota bacterium]
MPVAAPTRTEAVAASARLLARAGLVEAFGHVSARVADGFLLTATTPLGAATAADVHVLDESGEPAAGASDVPLEAPLHAAIYATRPDVGAICRTHSPAAVAAGARGEVPPLVHGLGAIAGEVRLCPRTDLVVDAAAGEEVAVALGDAACLLLRANGCLAVGADLAQAAVRAYFLEERCRVAEEAGGKGREMSGEELRDRLRWTAAEEERASRWLVWRFGDDARRTGKWQGNQEEPAT